MLVREVMTRRVLTVEAHWSLAELKSFLLEHGISGAPVVDAAGKLVGVVSSTDLLRTDDNETSTTGGFFSTALDRPLAGEELRSLVVETESTTSVGDVMTPVVFQVNEETPLDEAADTMVRGHIHRIVVTEKERVVGIVTALDLVRALRDLLRGSK